MYINVELINSILDIIDVRHGCYRFRTDHGLLRGKLSSADLNEKCRCSYMYDQLLSPFNILFENGKYARNTYVTCNARGYMECKRSNGTDNTKNDKNWSFKTDLKIRKTAEKYIKLYKIGVFFVFAQCALEWNVHKYCKSLSNFNIFIWVKLFYVLINFFMNFFMWLIIWICEHIFYDIFCLCLIIHS